MKNPTSDLRVTVEDTGNPYQSSIASFLAREFHASTGTTDSILEAVTNEFVGSGQIRFGPVPSPESIVAIRSVISKCVEANLPIPILCPWGSRKPNNTGVDIAELSALKTLSCLGKRIQAHYPPGICIRMRIEDIGGYYLFADEGPIVRHATKTYMEGLLRLIHVLDVKFVKPVPESTLMDEDVYNEVADKAQQILLQYISETDVRGLDSHQDLASWQQLEQMGWKGSIPLEQRAYYRERYERLYPGRERSEYTKMLAIYLAGSHARYHLRGTGIDESWGKDSHLQISFCPPVPGMPASMSNRTIHYRTLPEKMARTHLAPWRARGYLRISGDQIAVKISSWNEHLDLQPSTITLHRGDVSVEILAPTLSE